jgi:hypothetical protein
MYMLIRPQESIAESSTVTKAKAAPQASRLKDPSIAAEALTTKEDLALYYPATPNREATAALATAGMAAVATIATAVAFNQTKGRGKGGRSIDASPELSALPAREVSTMTIEELVKARKTALN